MRPLNSLVLAAKGFASVVRFLVRIAYISLTSLLLPPLSVHFWFLSVNVTTLVSDME